METSLYPYSSTNRNSIFTIDKISCKLIQTQNQKVKVQIRNNKFKRKKIHLNLKAWRKIQQEKLKYITVWIHSTN